MSESPCFGLCVCVCVFVCNNQALCSYSKCPLVHIKLTKWKINIWGVIHDNGRERESEKEIDRIERERALMLFNGLMQLCVYVCVSLSVYILPNLRPLTRAIGSTPAVSS